MSNFTKKILKICFLCEVFAHSSFSMDFHAKRSVFESSERRQTATIEARQTSISTEEEGVMNFDVLSHSIQEAERTVQSQIRRERDNATRVIVLGTTGSGKSTLVHALARKNLVVSLTDTEDSFKIDVENGMLPNFKIGHGISSATSIPVSWYDEHSNLVYWDCPGFLDTRGVSQDIINAFAIDQLFSSPSRIKILLAMQASDFQGARGMDAIHRLNRLVSLVPDLNQLKRSISLIVTKKMDNGFDSMRMVGGLLRKAQEELRQRQSEGRDCTDLEKAINLLDFLSRNGEVVSSFPAPTSTGTYQGFEDREKIISALQRTPVLNPQHILAFDESVLFNVLMMMERFCAIPQIIQEWKDLVRGEYKGKDVSTLRQWRSIISSLYEKKSQLDTPGKFDAAFSGSFPLRFQKSTRFLELGNRLQTAQRYLDFANRLALSGGRELKNYQLQPFVEPFIVDMISELQGLIEYKELIEQQERETRRIRENLDKAVQERAIQAQEADRQYKSLDSKLKQEKLEAERKHQSLQEQLRQARIETDERVRREVAAEKSRYDREISSLQSRLSSMDQTSLINRLRGRIEELEDQVRRYESRMGGGGQVVFIPGIGFARIG